MSIKVVRCTQRSKLQHDVTQDSGEAQEGVGDDLTHRTAGVIATVASVSRPGSAASTGGGSSARVGGRESGSDNRRSGGNGNGGSAFFNLIIDPGDERSQVGVLHVVGEDE